MERLYQMINCDYLYTDFYSNLENCDFLNNSCLIYSEFIEERNEVINSIKLNNNYNADFIGISYLSQDRIRVLASKNEYDLRCGNSMSLFINELEYKKVYLDITSLNNRATASLLRNMVKYDLDINLFYIAPQGYLYETYREKGLFNSISDDFEGIDPFPGFANFLSTSSDYVFIPILGFEGGRFSHFVDEIQPVKDYVKPIVGMPGYRIEYTFHSLWENRNPLKETHSWKDVEFAAANSITDLFMIFKKIQLQYKGCKLIIAPIGTKPHIIGAILFAIKYDRIVELVYDNPVCNKQRSHGVGTIIVYAASQILKHL